MSLSPHLPQGDPHEIHQALTLLHAPGSVVELRIPHAMTGQRGSRKKYRSTVAGFFNNFAALAQEAISWSGKSDGVYMTLNPITPDLLARYANRVEEGADGLTTDRHVLCRRWLPIDFDATRLAKISATDAEHDAALKRAVACRTWLRQQQWPEPLFADSGNGAHLLYRLDLPNDAASTTLIAHTLQALALLFNDAHVMVDETTYNAARVWKLYGTLVCKGDHLPQRPHRLARLIDVPDAFAVVTHEHLATLAALLPEPTSQPQHHGTGRKAFDLMQWVVHKQLQVVSQGPWSNGGYKWILNPCPWNPEHTNRAAYLVQFANGAIAAGCHHNGCADKDWQALRNLYDPGRHSVFKPDKPVKTASHGVSLPDTRATGKIPHIVTLATVQPEAVSWLWRPYIPRRKLTLVEGDPGMGKTWLMLQLAAAISRGTALPGCEEASQEAQGAGQPVLYLSAEDGLADTLRPRLDAAGADCTHIHALLGWQEHEGATVKTGSITLADIPIIQTAIATYQPALVILDPLQAYLGAKTDMYRANEVRPLLTELVVLAEQYDCAIVCVRHLTKASHSRAIYRGLGSIDFTAAARSVLLVAEEPHPPEEALDAHGTTRRVLAQSKSSLAPPGPSLLFVLRDGRFCWCGPSPLTADELTRGHSSQERRDAEVQRAEAWLRTYLHTGPRLAKEGYSAAAALGIAARTLMRAKKALGITSKKEGDVWFWLSPSSAGSCRDTNQHNGNVGNVGNVGTPVTLDTLPHQSSFWTQGCQHCQRHSSEQTPESQQSPEDCQHCQECQPYHRSHGTLHTLPASAERNLERPDTKAVSPRRCPTPGCPGTLHLAPNNKAAFCTVCRYRTWVES